MKLRFSSLLGALVLFPVLAGVVHCGSSDNPATTPDDGGPATPPEQDPEDGGATSQSEAGTVDLGSDANAPVTVCGGSKGDPHAVPLLDWQYRRYSSKYAVKLGVQDAFMSEPVAWSSNDVVVNGTPTLGTSRTSGGFSGPGPFGTRSLSSDDFAWLMPKTDVASYRKTLGWTDTMASLYESRTTRAKSGWSNVFVGGKGIYAAELPWALVKPVTTVRSDDTKYYVSTITPYRAQGWFLTVGFDHSCKADAFRALIGSDDPVNILDKSDAPFTRDEMSKFLVDNNAYLGLTVIGFGASDNAEVKAALNGTQASAASLDNLETMLTALTSALASDWAKSPEVTYDDLTSGKNSSWVIGSIIGDAVKNIPPAP